MRLMRLSIRPGSVPKYTGEFEWGGTFEMNPKRTALADDEYAAIVASFKTELGL